MALTQLFAPHRIAIYGASQRPASSGYRIISALQELGFGGDILPVNPAYDSVLGLRCHATLADLPGDIDAVALCVDAKNLDPALRAAAARGIGAAVIFSGLATLDAAAGDELRRMLRAVATAHGMAVCGPNCMGVLNPATASSLYLGTVLDRSRLAGNVALITQSGSVAIGMLGDTRRFGFSHVISSGDETVTTLADYIDHLVDDPDTAMIAAFIETVRDLPGFIAALERAATHNKPVVVLKIGRSPLARRAVLGHTGGIAGDGAVFSALLRRHRAIEVTSLDELTETLACLQNTRRPAGPRIGVVTASGGQVEMILDEAVQREFLLPALDPAIAADAAAVIGPISGNGNPLDAWGDGTYARNLPHGLHCMARQPDVDSVVLVSDTNDNQAMAPTRYTDFLLAASVASPLPFYFMNTRSGLLRLETVAKFAGTGVGMLTGLRPGLIAIGRVSRWQAHPALPRIIDHPTQTAVDAARAATRHRRRTIHEADSKRILAGLGLPVVAEHLVHDRQSAVRAAEELGYPVVLKAVSDDIPHRSEHGLIALALPDPAALLAAWSRLDSRLDALGMDPAGVARLVQPVIGDGLEVILGTATDPEIGPFIAFGPGGVLVELLAGPVVCPLPLREGEAAEMIAGSPVARLLAGYRGAPPRDQPALALAIEKLAAFAYAMRDSIAEIDLNPVFVHRAGQGCVVADALMVPQ